MSDLIKRADAIEAVDRWKDYDGDICWREAIDKAKDALSTLPSAEAVSMEEHVKELNDLASAWKNKFINAEKRTEKIYDETMAKVANECKECKERLRNLRPSAEAVQGEWIGYNADKEDWLRTDGTPIFLVCDKCNGTVINNGSAHWNYCPNCGAKMTKGGDDE